MSTACRSIGSITAAFAALVLISGPATAAKMTYEKAWADCKAQVDRSVPGDQASARHSAGAACMKAHGYRLKK
jgi:hypothetical protein